MLQDLEAWTHICTVWPPAVVVVVEEPNSLYCTDLSPPPLPTPPPLPLPDVRACVVGGEREAGGGREVSRRPEIRV